MFSKHMKADTCSLRYCLPKHPNDPRHPVVLMGDPQNTQALIDAIGKTDSFESDALCFERIITKEEMRRAAYDYLDHLLPGQSPGVDFDACLVYHLEGFDDDGANPTRCSGHLIIPKIHLPSQKRLDPYIKRRDRSRMTAWRTSSGRFLPGNGNAAWPKL
jgi:hypothetical protein